VHAAQQYGITLVSHVTEDIHVD